jgi:hypothetical protein
VDRAWSRPDGTFRFLGLSAGKRYQAQIRGRERATVARTAQVQGGPRVIDQRADRQPLKVSHQLLKEVRELSADRPEPAKTLVNLACERWVKGPVDWSDLRGKSVLLYIGNDPRQLTKLQIAHELYGEHGLRAIGILPARAEMPPQLMQLLVERTGVTMPLALAEPAEAARFKLREPGFLLYGPAGKLQLNLQDNQLYHVRQYMLAAIKQPGGNSPAAR